MAAAALCLLALCPAAFGAAAESLRALAAEARTTLAQRIEPPIARLPFLCTATRTQGSPMREVLIRQQAEAIEALLASATTPAEVARVRRLLQQLQRFGASRDAEDWLRERLPGPAGLRLAASLGELPAALQERIHPGCPGVSTHVGAVGRTGLPLGRLARTDYEAIAAAEPADPWHPLVLAWVSGLDGEGALRRSLALSRASSATDGRRVELFAWQQLAWLHARHGRERDARAAAMQAVRLARDAVPAAGRPASTPETVQARVDEAYTTVAMARVLADAGAAAAALALLTSAEPLLRGLAAARPDDLPVQIATIDALGHLASAQKAAGAAGGDRRYVDEAWARYQALQARTPYERMGTASGVPGTLLVVALLASVLTLVVGSVMLWRYRRRVAALMGLAARSAAAVPVADPPAPLPAVTRLHGTADGLGGARRAHRHAAVVQVAAGLAFGLAACLLQLHADGTEPNVNRVAVMTWTWAWPTVLALGIVWDGDRRRRRMAWAAYFAGLLLLCTLIALGDTPPLKWAGTELPPFVQGLVYWASSLSFTPILLLFLNRTLRSIGPVLLAIMLVATTGGILALEAASTPVGTAAAVSALSALHVPVEWMLPAVMLAGMLAFVPLAWAAGWLLRASYAARWISDQGLVIDTIWLFQAALLSLALSWTAGVAAAGLGFAAFMLHKTITLAGMWPVARAARRRTPLRLLLLRVFSRRDAHGRRRSRRADTERLFDLLSTRWRYAGPLHMIGAPDLAGTTLNPHAFLDFLTGGLHRRFIVEPREVPARVAALDERSDLDARWRVNELFCGNDAWRPAVLALMARSDLVAMDLRHFRPDNDGCVFELHALLDLVPASRIALLVDRTTDLAFLRRTIAARLSGADGAPADPSSAASAPPGMAFIDIDEGGERTAVEALLQRLARLEEGAPRAEHPMPARPGSGTAGLA